MRKPPTRPTRAKKTRRFEIDGQGIWVLDGLFGARDIAAVSELMRTGAYTLSDYDSEETSYSRHWKCEYSPSAIGKVGVFAEIDAEVRRLCSPRRLRLARLHANLHLYGDLQFPHTDSIDGVTGLFFANERWDERWMGETLFYDRAREPVSVVAPRPGRLLVFPGNVLHRAGVPVRECFEPRLSLAFKYVSAASPKSRSSPTSRAAVRGAV